LNWSRRYAIKSYLLSTVWIAPVLALVLEQVTFRIAYAYQFDLGWFPGFAAGSREGSIAIADYVISSSIAFIVFHLQLVNRRDSGRERPVDAANHRDHSVARQCHPRISRDLRVRTPAGSRGKSQDRYDSAVTCEYDRNLGPTQCLGIYVSNRSRGAIAAPRQYCMANRSAGTSGNRRRLSRCTQRVCRSGPNRDETR
jgi:hypothetical protein